MPAETHEFQVESRQLLQMMIHSIYSNKDIFLRELISNASDALDKLRLASLRGLAADAEVSDLHISIEADSTARTLTVRDNGIGMSRSEVTELIGTIANSGTASFLREWRQGENALGAESLIGRFGVGFYSAFMVADEVTLVTRRAGERDGTRWTSTGEGTYTIDTAVTPQQGTAVTLRLKAVDSDDQLHDYSAAWKIREVVKQYSDFVAWPIRMKDAGLEPDDGTDPVDGDAEAATEPETLNSMKALWARPREEVSEAEYAELYRHMSHDWSDPLETIRLQAEGTFEYQALLFFPSRAPHDLFTQGYRAGLHLYVKRVFVMDDCEALLPTYLRFVRGIVDAQDLSLNVSREILQQDRRIAMMHRRLTKRVLATVKDMMSRDPERYFTFWGEFGRAVKEGLITDPPNREAILAVSAFPSTHDTHSPTGLREYIERMAAGQEHIYYLTGDSRQAIENSPHLESFRERGIEVLLLSDPIDAVWVDQVNEFEGRRLRSAAHSDAEESSDSDDKAGRAHERQEEFSELLAWMTQQLGGDVKQVRLSTRLTTSPACLVSDEGGLTPALESVYRAMRQDVPRSLRVLELNPGHPLVTGLNAAFGEHRDTADADLGDLAELVRDLALLAEGGMPSDPSGFTKRVADRLGRGL
ncbi:molecular chaperone HtpG [Streptomyces sp. PTM05]|uniref:Chaperone protein HtpG n=1 Tax=Streptantibioticus parmotrematis TaxID=2873249 RepID=A0ABS7QV09_9ACTN|nr:molecular chaperone HtpG [Streptantibioticus parmotrematis]MBY8887037.1 molecular chaperone HtpG [Streptantibioticus parmotrematis]